jgi:hypothetical protein
VGIWANAGASSNYTAVLRVMTGPITALDIIAGAGHKPIMVADDTWRDIAFPGLD